MQHHEIVVPGFFDRPFEVVAMGRSVEQARSWNHPGRIGEPGRIPERPDLAGGLVARARTSIEVVIGGRIEKKRLHHVHILVVSANLSDWLVRLYKPQRAQARTSADEWLAKIDPSALRRCEASSDGLSWQPRDGFRATPRVLAAAPALCTAHCAMERGRGGCAGGFARA